MKGIIANEIASHEPGQRELKESIRRARGAKFHGLD